MWDDHSWVVPRIRAALDAGVPPSAILLRDPAHKEYDRWDLMLVAALRIFDELMVGSVPVYWDRSDRVAFDVKVNTSKSQKALDRKQEQDRKKFEKNPSELFGRQYYVVPRTVDGGPLPTMQEWLEEQGAKRGKPDAGPSAR